MTKAIKYDYIDKPTPRSRTILEDLGALWDRAQGGIQTQSVIDTYIMQGYIDFNQCNNFGIESPSQCAALVGVLTPGNGGIVTDQERIQLKGNSFSDEFIEQLAGEDGKKLFKMRLDHMMKRRICGITSDLKEACNTEWINELSSIGAEADYIVNNLFLAGYEFQMGHAYQILSGIGTYEAIFRLLKESVKFKTTRGCANLLDNGSENAEMILRDMFINGTEDERRFALNIYSEAKTLSSSTIDALAKRINENTNYETTCSAIDILAKNGSPNALIALLYTATLASNETKAAIYDAIAEKSPLSENRTIAVPNLQADIFSDDANVQRSAANLYMNLLSNLSPLVDETLTRVSKGILRYSEVTQK